MTTLERELRDLKHRVLRMGELAESMVAAACAAVAQRDAAAVGRVLTLEPSLDAMQVDVDAEAVRLIAVYSPAARDLRFLLMVARINSDLERIGDQAVDICEYVDLLATDAPRPALRELPVMALLAREMLHESLEAFRDDSVGRAEAVMRRDTDIDRIDRQVIREVAEQPADGAAAAARSIGLLVARSLERIADHATNICEELFYVVEGEDIRHRT